MGCGPRAEAGVTYSVPAAWAAAGSGLGARAAPGSRGAGPGARGAAAAGGGGSVEGASDGRPK